MRELTPEDLDLCPYLARLYVRFHPGWFRASGYELDDLVQIGYLGLDAAAKRWDPNDGRCAWRTYAINGVKRAIYAAVNLRWRQNSRKPPQAVLDLDWLSHGRDDGLEEVELRDSLRFWWTTLSESQATALRMRGAGLTVKQIARKLGCTPSNVRMLVTAARKKWRDLQEA